jgi:hypothetical protein
MKVLLYTVFKDLTIASFVTHPARGPKTTSPAHSSLAASLDGDLFENTIREGGAGKWLRELGRDCVVANGSGFVILSPSKDAIEVRSLKAEQCSTQGDPKKNRDVYGRPPLREPQKIRRVEIRRPLRPLTIRTNRPIDPSVCCSFVCGRL